MPADAKTLLPKRQAGMLCSHVVGRIAYHQICAACGVLQPFKDRRTRRLQIFFGTIEVGAPWFNSCRCCVITPMTEMTVLPACALPKAHCTPELERAELNHVQFETHGRSAWLDGGCFPYDGFPERTRSDRCYELIMNAGARRWRTCAAWP